MVQLEEIRKNEDPRLSFATPEFKEAQRTFTEHFKVGQNTMPRAEQHAAAPPKGWPLFTTLRGASCTLQSIELLCAPNNVGV